MRIAQLIDTYPDEPGGLGVVVTQGSRALVQLGHQVDCFVPRWAWKPEGPARPLDSFAGGYDVIHTHASSVSLELMRAVLRTRVPVVHLMHGTCLGLGRAIGRGHRPRILLGALRELAGCLVAHRIPCVSEFVAQEVQRMFRIREDRLEVVHGGTLIFDRVPEIREEIRRELGLAPTDHVFVTGARPGSPEKRYPLLLDAFASVRAQHPNARLLISTGERLPSTAGLLETGWVSYERSIQLLLAGDCFVNASAYESGPLGTVSALSHGVRVVSTRVGLVRDLDLPPGSAFLCDQSREGLVGAMCDAVVEAERTRTVRTPIHYRWSFQEMAQQWVRIYEKAIREPRRTIGCW